MNSIRLSIVVLCLPALCAAQATSGYTISTVAGNNGLGAGFSGDGSAASAAQLAGPISLAVDSQGSLYIADEANNRIRKVAGGTINTVAGNGLQGFGGDGAAATSAELWTPNAVAVDSAGNIYISDSRNSVIRKVSTSGTITTVAGNVNSLAGFAGDNGPATLAQIAFPQGLAVDGAGNIFIADTGNLRIRKVTAGTGVMTTVAGNGTYGSSGDGGQGAFAHLANPVGLAVDTAGNLYIADYDNNTIRKLATNGVITRVAGSQFGTAGYSGDGGPATSALLNHPQGVAVDAAGNIYIADHTNSRIRMVSANGTISTIAGNGGFGYVGDGGPAINGALNFPVDVAVDSSGDIYIADYQNQVVRQLTPSAPGGGGTGLPAINAGGVVSAAAFGGFTSIAPGSWIEIYGKNLAADTRQWGTADFNGQTGPTSLDRTSVTVGGQPAFIDYISPGQVNAEVPTNVSTGQQPIVVNTAGGASAAYTITINPTQPGMLAPPSFVIGGKQYVAALFPDNATFVLPVNAIPGVASRPAKAGETIIIYGVGFGPVTGVPAGQIAPATSSVVTQPLISIGGTPAALSYAGLSGGAVGLYQFNVVVPAIAVGSAVPLTFSLGGTNGLQTLYTAVQ